jgi:DNA-binding MarR family transcriptional regulator
LTPQVSAQTVFVKLLHAHGSMMRTIEARLVAQHGLSANDFEALVHLSHAEEGAMRRIDLAEELRLSPSGVTRLLDGLQRAGLTCNKSCETDARVTYAMITDKGRETLRDAADTHAAACEELIGAHLGESDLDDLAGLLDRLPGVGPVEPGACAGPQ